MGNRRDGRVCFVSFGEHDDLVDATTLALLRYREGNLVQLYDDHKEPEIPRDKRKYEYYG